MSKFKNVWSPTSKRNIWFSLTVVPIRYVFAQRLQMKARSGTYFSTFSKLMPQKFYKPTNSKHNRAMHSTWFSNFQIRSKIWQFLPPRSALQRESRGDADVSQGSSASSVTGCEAEIWFIYQQKRKFLFSSAFRAVVGPTELSVLVVNSFKYEQISVIIKVA